MRRLGNNDLNTYKHIHTDTSKYWQIR